MSSSLARSVVTLCATGAGNFVSSGTWVQQVFGPDQFAAITKNLVHQALVQELGGGRDPFGTPSPTPLRGAIDDNQFNSLVASMRDESVPTRVTMFRLGDGSWLFCGRVK